MPYTFKVERSGPRFLAQAGEMSRDGTIFWPLTIFRVGRTEEEARRLASEDADAVTAYYTEKANAPR